MSLTLLDWRRTVAGLSAAVRAGRERLIREHPDSPIAPDRRASFAGLDHWPWAGERYGHGPALRAQ